MDENVQQPQEAILSDAPQENKTSQADVLKELLAVEKDKYVRLLAEFDNMRKRQERERFELIKYAHEEVIVESLKIYDDLKRALSAMRPTDTDPVMAQGIKLVVANFEELLKKYDVKIMEAVGKPFDPNSQEVLLQQETKDFDDGVVMEVFENGYTLAGRVVRTAKVKVAKNINS